MLNLPFNPRSFWPLTTILALSIAGCKGTTFKAPTEDYPLQRLDAEIEIEKDYFAESVNYLAFKLQSQNQPDSEINWFSPLNSYIFGLLLLNGSSDDTYKSVAEHLHVTIPDYSPLNIAANDWLISQKDSPNLHVKSGLFFIWPMKLDRPFTNRMAQTLDFDVLKLGTAGIASQQALDKWAQTNSGFPDKGLNQPLDRHKDVLLSMSIATFKGQTTNQISVQENQDWTMFSAPIENGDFELVWFEPKTTTSSNYPTFEQYLELNKVEKKSNTSDSIPEIKVHNVVNMSKILEKTSLEPIVKGPLDLRYISLELKGEFSIGQNLQFIHIDLPSNSATKKDSPQKSGCLIRDSQTGLIVLMGSN